MMCISTSSMQVFWNGEVTDAFLPSPGVRQGYPLFITITIFLGKISS